MSVHSDMINEMANEKLKAFYEELRRALGADAGELVDDTDLFEIVETVREQRDAARSTVVKVLQRFGCGQGDGVRVGALPEDGAWPDALIVEHAERIAMERFDEMVGAKIKEQAGAWRLFESSGLMREPDGRTGNPARLWVRNNLSTARARCIAACIGTGVSPSVDIGDMIEVFGKEPVLRVAESLVGPYNAPDCVVRTLKESPS